MDFDPNLRQYATYTQWAQYEATCRLGSMNKAADELHVHSATVSSAVKSITRKAAARGYSPDHGMEKQGAEGFHLKGYSELVDSEGNTKVRWNKFDADKEQMLEDVLDAALRVSESFAGQSNIVPEPKNTDSNLINVIPMGDPHIGLYTHRAEVYDDFDCQIVEDIMLSAIDHLVDTAPKADTALIISLGDFYHADNLEGVTSRSKHKLDVDGKWHEILEVGIRIMRRTIDSALRRHKTVTFISAQGNHDDMTSQVLAIVMREYYRNDDRVRIMDATHMFQYFQFGRNLFGVTHGHTIKPLDLEPIMARDCNDIWSSTSHRKFFVGHFHSQRVHDLRNCTVEYYRTLAAGDAWSVSAGYRSQRDMRCETWHSDNGHVGTNIFNPLLMG